MSCAELGPPQPKLISLLSDTEDRQKLIMPRNCLLLVPWLLRLLYGGWITSNHLMFSVIASPSICTRSHKKDKKERKETKSVFNIECIECRFYSKTSK